MIYYVYIIHMYIFDTGVLRVNINRRKRNRQQYSDGSRISTTLSITDRSFEQKSNMEI